MAEFSKEFLDKNGWDFFEADFSIFELFKQMENNETIFCICEGFGISGILKKNDVCYLLEQEKITLLDEILKK